jgi:hypothetical protein
MIGSFRRQPTPTALRVTLKHHACQRCNVVENQHIARFQRHCRKAGLHLGERSSGGRTNSVHQFGAAGRSGGQQPVGKGDREPLT